MSRILNWIHFYNNNLQIQSFLFLFRCWRTEKGYPDYLRRQPPPSPLLFYSVLVCTVKRWEIIFFKWELDLTNIFQSVWFDDQSFLRPSEKLSKCHDWLDGHQEWQGDWRTSEEWSVSVYNILDSSGSDTNSYTEVCQANALRPSSSDSIHSVDDNEEVCPSFWTPLTTRWICRKLILRLRPSLLLLHQTKPCPWCETEFWVRVQMKPSLGSEWSELRDSPGVSPEEELADLSVLPQSWVRKSSLPLHHRTSRNHRTCR